MKVGITGSEHYQNTSKVKEILFKLKEKYKNDLIILSGGEKNGAEKFVRKFSIDFGIEYKEFNPAFTVKNLYSVMPDSYFEKPFHPTHRIHSDYLMMRDCDVMIILNSENEVLSSRLKSIVNKIKKINKPITIIT